MIESPLFLCSKLYHSSAVLSQSGIPAICVCLGFFFSFSFRQRQNT